MKNSLILLFLFISCSLYSQRFFSLGNDKKFTDSLEVVVNSTKLDSVKCISAYKLSDLYFRKKDNVKFKYWLSKGNRLSKKYPFLTAASGYFNALAYLYEKNNKTYEVKLIAANKNLEKFRNTESYKLQARILLNLSIVEQLKGNDKNATQMVINKAIPLARKANDAEVLIALYKAVGISLMNNGDSKKAKYYYDLCIQLFGKLQQDYPTRLENIVEVYCLNALNATQLEDFKEAGIYVSKAGDVIKDYPGSNLNPLFYDVKSSLYLKLGQFQNTITSSDAGIKQALLHKDRLSLNNLKINKLQALSGLKRYAEAKEVVISLIADDKLFLNDRRQCYLELATFNELLGDHYGASKAKSQYIALNDSLYTMNHKKEIATLEATFKNAENEARISQLEMENDKAVLVAVNNKLYNGVFLLVLCIFLIIIIVFGLNTRNQKKLNFEKEKNYMQNLNVLKKQKEIEVMQAAINGEELERKRIARDLHDGIGSMLSSQKMRLMKMHADSEAGDKAEISNIITILSNSITELRQVAYNLMPEVLSRLGLKHALSDLCFMHRSDSVDIIFHANEIREDIPESIQITIYRIVQELINNALKHAEATEIIVDCSQNENLFFITVEDNGKGFITGNAKQLSGLGLKNLQNRLELLNGNIDINSSPDYGTIFNIELTL